MTNLYEYVVKKKSCSHLFEQWNEDKNGKMENYTFGSPTKVYWKCPKVLHHEYTSAINSRIHGTQCPICENRVVCPNCHCNSVYEEHPHLRIQWDIEKNGDMKLFLSGSAKKVQWVCPKENHHTWVCAVRDRIRGHNCPICVGQMVCQLDFCNSLEIKCPELKSEWDEKNNGEMKLYSHGSKKKVSWICNQISHHIWIASIYTRSGPQSSKCPYCTNTILCKKDFCNSLYNNFEHLRIEWDEENGDMRNFFGGSNVKVNWICKKNKSHIWKTTINHRTSNGSNCPYCLYKSEDESRNILEQILNIEFIKARPSFLEKLELDGYNDKLKIAFEYQGIQHFKYIQYFHKNGEDDFMKQKQRDETKRSLCIKNNISLIEIPYQYTYNNLPALKKFIMEKIETIVSDLKKEFFSEDLDKAVMAFQKHYHITKNKMKIPNI
ncbi:MAG: hypothetical protein Harvfovirus13_21 [Harvfovirus sp.]|uniref:Treble clef zinc finger domain-containing protein n=1 Tax=Harvfovirus sp. TaxID=2487768 RepID=A0A3G5A1D6_9VIRU|nr:MAG: hypothetical protein Harvfovirus13_21 [Harvfovirus sp.]